MGNTKRAYIRPTNILNAKTNKCTERNKIRGQRAINIDVYMHVPHEIYIYISIYLYIYLSIYTKLNLSINLFIHHLFIVDR